jgi:hypothetical protein
MRRQVQRSLFWQLLSQISVIVGHGKAQPTTWFQEADAGVQKLVRVRYVFEHLKRAYGIVAARLLVSQAADVIENHCASESSRNSHR